ncbi:MAG: hypothetical protein AAGJ35_10685 [Myxococcota bacterium]
MAAEAHQVLQEQTEAAVDAIQKKASEVAEATQDAMCWDGEWTQRGPTHPHVVQK